MDQQTTAFPGTTGRASFQATARSSMSTKEAHPELVNQLMNAAAVHAEKDAAEPDAPCLSDETKTILAALLAEFLGTLFLVLVAVGIQANEINWQMNGATGEDTEQRQGPDSTLTVAISTGLCYTVLIYTFERISGGHFNPAITLAAMVSRRIGILPAVLYIVIQIVAGIAGSAIYDGMSGNDNYGELGVNKIANDFDTGSIFGIELMATFWVTMVWLFSLDLGQAPCGRHRDAQGPMYIGFAYILATALTVRWDRAGLNPARSLGPSIMANKLDQHWVFWMGPMIGGMSGALVFELFLWLSPGNRAEKKQAF